MRSAAESAQWGDLTLASHYRRKAHLSLARARDARWVGREQTVLALVRDALWWRRFAHHFAARARQEVRS